MLELFFYHLPMLGVALLLALSLNLVWRAGLFSLGHYGFWAIGAYAAVIGIRLLGGLGKQGDEVWHGSRGVMALVLALALAAALAGGAGYLLVRLFGKLSSDYFAVATLAFAEAVRLFVTNWDYVGASHGANLPYLVFDRGADRIWRFYLLHISCAWALVSALLAWHRRIDRSVLGLFISATHDDRLAARVSGVPVLKVERDVFAGSAAVAGLAGVISAFYSTSVVPSDFDFASGLPIVLYVVLGGRTTRGCLVATTCVYAAYEAA